MTSAAFCFSWWVLPKATWTGSVVTLAFYLCDLREEVWEKAFNNLCYYQLPLKIYSELSRIKWSNDIKSSLWRETNKPTKPQMKPTSATKKKSYIMSNLVCVLLKPNTESLGILQQTWSIKQIDYPDLFYYWKGDLCVHKLYYIVQLTIPDMHAPVFDGYWLAVQPKEHGLNGLCQSPVHFFCHW